MRIDQPEAIKVSTSGVVTSQGYPSLVEQRDDCEAYFELRIWIYSPQLTILRTFIKKD